MQETNDPRIRFALWVLRYKAIRPDRIVKISKIHDLVRIQYSEEDGKIKNCWLTTDELAKMLST